MGRAEAVSDDCSLAVSHRALYPQRGIAHHLISGSAKPCGRAIAGVLMIVDIVR